MSEFRNRFLLSSEESELLLEFEAYPSLARLALHMERDHSIVARSFKRISEKFPVVEKRGGRWTLTEVGRSLNDCTRASIAQQSATLAFQSVLRIGTNREFSARVLAPDFTRIQQLFPATELSIHSYEQGVEKALIEGQIDIGIDCDRPMDPEIRYKLVVTEPIIVVASKAFLQKKAHRIDGSDDHYWQLPHLLCERLYPDKILSKPENKIKIAARFNDIASVRAACVEGVGWALLPHYAVADELKSGKLIQLGADSFGKSKYGIWWPRRRDYLRDSAEKLIGWLAKKGL